MTPSSIAQYLEQKRTVRPIDWSIARRESVAAAAAAALKPRAALAAYEAHNREAGAFRRTTLVGEPQPPEPEAEPEVTATPSPYENGTARNGFELFRPRETPAPPPGPDIETRLAEAYHRGVQEGLDAARNEAATARALERAELQKRAVVERLDFQMNEYGKLAEAIASGLSEVERRTADVVARILKPFLAEAVARQAVDELAANVARLAGAGQPTLMKIKGPERLLALLKQRLATLAIEVEFTMEAGVEVTVEAHQTTISTEIAPWAGLIASLTENG